MISQIGHCDSAKLVEAIMPYPDGGIKDCLRVFQTYDGTIPCIISNSDWSLLEKSDMVEIKYTYDIDSTKNVAKALMVKTYPLTPTNDEDELVGIIFPDNSDFGGINNG
jgi:hypothetical protein